MMDESIVQKYVEAQRIFSVATYDGAHPETTVDRWTALAECVVVREARRAKEPIYIGASSMTDQMMIFDVFHLVRTIYQVPTRFHGEHK